MAKRTDWARETGEKTNKTAAGGPSLPPSTRWRTHIARITEINGRKTVRAAAAAPGWPTQATDGGRLFHIGVDVQYSRLFNTHELGWPGFSIGSPTVK
jgi:hypothetical protein